MQLVYFNTIENRNIFCIGLKNNSFSQWRISWINLQLWAAQAQFYLFQRNLFWKVQQELQSSNRLTRIFHAVWYVLKRKRSVCSRGKHTPVTPCNIRFSLSAQLHAELPAEPEFFRQDDCVFCFSRVMPFLSLSEIRRGDIRVTAGCQVEHQTPPRAPAVSRGGGTSWCVSWHQITAWLGARQRSPARSVHIIDKMKRSDLSLMHPVYKDTMRTKSSLLAS